MDPTHATTALDLAVKVASGAYSFAARVGAPSLVTTGLALIFAALYLARLVARSGGPVPPSGDLVRGPPSAGGQGMIETPPSGPILHGDEPSVGGSAESTPNRNSHGGPG